MKTASLTPYALELLKKIEADPEGTTSFYCDAVDLEALEELERQKKIIFIEGQENKNRLLVPSVTA